MILRTTLAVLFVSLVTAVATAEEWPGWRGPDHQGGTTEKALPTEWDASQNVAWKTEIPGEGWSSPIIFGDCVFLTAATDGGAKCHIVCLQRATGKILWDKAVLDQELKNKSPRNSFATPTPCTDGKRVYACFADGSFVAVDYDGKVAWTNRDFPFYSQHGLATSPILCGDLLVMARDSSNEGDDKGLGWQRPWDKGFLLALDKNTGKLRWKGDRGQSRIAHVAPNVMRVGDKDQIISGAGDVVQGFDPASGNRLWSVESKGEGVVPSVVVGGGLAFTCSGFGDPTVRAVRPGTADDASAAKIAWESKKAVPMLASFAYAGDLLFTVSEGGIVLCLDPATGEQVWQQRLRGQYSISPIAADGKILFLSDEGEATIVEAARQYKQAGKGSVGQRCQASPAFAHGCLVIRGEKDLFCFGVTK